MITCATINKLIKKVGINSKIVKGNGYYYFIGELFDKVPSIYQNNLSGLTPENICKYIFSNLPNYVDEIINQHAKEGRTGRIFFSRKAINSVAYAIGLNPAHMTDFQKQKLKWDMIDQYAKTGSGVKTGDYYK